MATVSDALIESSCEKSAIDSLKDPLSKNWNILKIGTQFFHSLSDLREEFGPLLKKDDIKYLCTYYSVRDAVPKNRLTDKAKAKISDLFMNRIKTIETSQDFQNNSFEGSQNHPIIIGLQKEVDEITGKKGIKTADTISSKSPISKKDLLKQFFKGLYYTAFYKGDTLKVSREFNQMMKDLEDMPADEQIVNASEILKKLDDDDYVENKTSENSLKKYIGSTSTSNSTTINTSITTDNKKKIEIIKLFTLFQTGEMLDGFNSTKPKSVDTIFDRILGSIPHMVDDILLTYRSFTRFYRARYTSVMKQLNSFISNNIPIKTYPIEVMTELVFSMYNMAIYMNPSLTSLRKHKLFPTNEGLLCFTLDNPSKERSEQYAIIYNMIKEYRNSMNTTVGRNDEIDFIKKDALPYQLAHMHVGRKDKQNRKPLIQLIRGSDIVFKEEIMKQKVDELSRADSADPDKTKYEELKQQIIDFFKDKNKKLYIIYQVAPEIIMNKDRRQEIKIKQLNTIRCILGTITDKLEKVDNEELDATLPRSIETPTLATTTETQEKEILMKLIDKNTCKDFGITIKDKLELIQSTTHIILTLLNAQYLNNKLKALNKKINPPSASASASASASTPTPAAS
jgi:hypothetical protein